MDSTTSLGKRRVRIIVRVKVRAGVSVRIALIRKIALIPCDPV